MKMLRCAEHRAGVREFTLLRPWPGVVLEDHASFMMAPSAPITIRQDAIMNKRNFTASVMLSLSVLAINAASAQTFNVTTHHYDNLRTGWNSTETTLTPGKVGGGSFQLQNQIALDAQVDTQPLLLTNQTINGATHDVLYVTTENDTVYALDAASGAVLLTRSLGTPVPQSALPGGCGNNSNIIGIDGTPVIDTVAGILYVIAYTYENSQQIYRLHALKVDSLADTVTPVVISASATLANGQTYEFNPAANRQRPGMLLANGNVYAGFGSFCDINANLSRGWVLGWQTGTLAPLAANQLNDARAKSPDSFFLSSVWMSGTGLASSAAGDIYFVTGNTDGSGDSYNHITNIAESAVQLSADLSTVKGLFTPTGGPNGHVSLDEQDLDYGSGGLMLLPPQAVASNNLAVAAGKVGIMYLMNADNLANGATVVTGKAMGQVNIGGGCWCSPSYFTGSDGFGRVVSSGGNNVVLWKVAGGTEVHLQKGATSGVVAGGAQDPGFFTSVSTNGTTANSAVIWAVGRPVNSSPANVTLYAFNIAGKQLFSGVAGTWPNTGGNANIVPVVANGKVYVASYEQLSIYGLGAGAAAAAPSVRPQAAQASAAQIELPAGQHEISGTVQDIDATTLTVRTRSGTVIKVDGAAAFANFQAAPPSAGHGILVRGTIDESGVVHAVTLLHAKDNPAIWLPDR
jgi:hypothetical protein